MVGGTIVTPARRAPVRAGLVWILVVPFAAWALARVAGLERGGPLTQVMSATPYVALGSLLPLLVAAFGRRPLAACVAALTSVALAFCVLPRAFGDGGVAGGRPFTVLTVNLLVGRADVMDLVRRVRPDVLSVQELTPAAVERLEGVMPYRVLQGDVGLYSRHPLNGFVVSPPGGPVEVVPVHAPRPSSENLATWRAVLGSLPGAGSGTPRILAGDFNATLDHAALREVLARGYTDAADRAGAGLVPTWPENTRLPPMITIDHVLVDTRVGVREVTVHSVPGTDHRAVVARLVLPQESAGVVPAFQAGVQAQDVLGGTQAVPAG
ncbi:endonuclease/exonuclease/phosphatase family protein [Nonomuraea sp. NPDC050790]|uniref:endonuclease/exonuclease/phosphatase family protein n=1 Tax=Nonomuraea sp. NPDC050790 TaxID=3364371 RepID=UPI0037935922